MMWLGVMCTNNLEMFMFASILLSSIDSSSIMPTISQRNIFFSSSGFLTTSIWSMNRSDKVKSQQMLMIFTFAIAIASVLAMTKIHATKILFIMNFVHAQALSHFP